MDRFVSFIDAGYVYAAGGALLHNTTNRALLDLDVEGLLSVLDGAMRAEMPPGVDFLRHYWYDAAINGVPQQGHLRIGDLPGVKVRLGRLTLNGQKGVDSLLVRDMMKLSAEHAVCTAFLLSGDEDLRQGVLEAQDSGVKVILLGFEPTTGQNQSEALVREADGRRILTRADLEGLFTLRSEPLRDLNPVAIENPSFDAFAVGQEFANSWLLETDPEEVARVRGGEQTSRETDARLIRALLTAADLPFGVRLDPRILAHGRAGFRAVVVPDAAPVEPPTPDESITAGEPAVAVADDAVAAELAAHAPLAPVEAPDAEPVPVLPPTGPGGEYARLYRQSVTRAERDALLAQAPVLPQALDADLLKHLTAQLGLPFGTPVDPELRKTARRDFWTELQRDADAESRAAAASGGAAPDVPSPYDAGLAFGKEWRESVPQEEVWRVGNLVRNRLGLPQELDRLLLNAGSALFGYPLEQDIRYELRRGFGDAVWY